MTQDTTKTPEFYKVLDPKDVPPSRGRGTSKSKLRLAMERMNIGDTIALPERDAGPQRSRVHNARKEIGWLFSTHVENGVCYVTRLPDDAS